MNKDIISKYAQLVVKVGVNIKENDNFIINFNYDGIELAREVQKELYKNGAKDVICNFNDGELTLNRYKYGKKEVFENFPKFKVDYMESQYKEKYHRVAIISPNPELLKSVDKEILKLDQLTSNKATQHLHAYMDAGDIKWVVIACPSKIWAKSAFPDMDEDEALELLWKKVSEAIRLDQEDPVKAWEEHNKELKKNEKWLDDMKFEKLHYEAEGTDLIVYLADDHKWIGGSSDTPDGVSYMANMPTEEIFTTPHMNKVDGTLKATKPLALNGNLIEGMSFVFKDGKVVEFKAEKNGEILENMMNMDEGGRRLGEVALVPHSSPISKTGVLFNNTLFDENASCHFAVGRSYTETIIGGEEMDKDELLKKGANRSMIHIDFMVGSDKLNITGIKKDGTEVKIFTNGEWANK